MDDGSVEVVIVARSSSLREELAGVVRDSGLLVVAAVASLRDWRPRFVSASCVVVAVDEPAAALERLPAETAVLLVGASDPRPAARLARSGRAWGVLPRGAGGRQIVAAIEMLARGLVVVPARLARELAEGLPGEPADGLSSEAGDTFDSGTVEETLTPRELEVLELVSEGHSNKVIAASLGISDHTVKFHLAAICGKLGASSRTEAVRLAVRRGLITL